MCDDHSTNFSQNMYFHSAPLFMRYKPISLGMSCDGHLVREWYFTWWKYIWSRSILDRSLNLLVLGIRLLTGVFKTQASIIIPYTSLLTC